MTFNAYFHHLTQSPFFLLHKLDTLEGRGFSWSFLYTLCQYSAWLDECSESVLKSVYPMFREDKRGSDRVMARTHTKPTPSAQLSFGTRLFYGILPSYVWQSIATLVVNKLIFNIILT